MGILGKLALLPVSPVLGVVWLAEQLEQIAADEAYGSDALRRRLTELQLAYEDGLIDADELEAAAQELMDASGTAGQGGGLRFDP